MVVIGLSVAAVAGVAAAGRANEGLGSAAYRGDIGRIQTLLRKGADPDARTSAFVTKELFDMTPVLWAVEGDQAEAITILASAGADLEAAHPFGLTPLEWALSRSNFRAAVALARAGADVNVVDDEGRPPLHRAAWRGDLGSTLAILAAGADPSLASKYGDRAFEMCFFGFRERPRDLEQALRAAVEAKLDVNVRLGNGTTLLMMTARTCSPEFVGWLVDRGADPTMGSPAGYPADFARQRTDGRSAEVIAAMQDRFFPPAVPGATPAGPP